MRNSSTSLLAVAAALSFAATASAQSSGNFAADIQTAQCALAASDGSLSGGSTKHLFSTTIKTPNSNETTLLITPALLTGLYTNSYITTMEPTHSESAAVVVSVLFDGNPVAPETADHPEVTYDGRYQQISTQLFSQLSECRDSNNQKCDFSLIQSTLSAHSFNFVVPSPGVGTHSIDVSWRLECTKDGSPTDCSNTPTQNSAGACVGPGTLIVQQVKAFTQSGGITVQ
jgi:hypothetical protein